MNDDKSDFISLVAKYLEEIDVNGDVIDGYVENVECYFSNMSMEDIDTKMLTRYAEVILMFLDTIGGMHI